MALCTGRVGIEASSIESRYFFLASIGQEDMLGKQDMHSSSE
jgi:hypothetical protein